MSVGTTITIGPKPYCDCVARNKWAKQDGWGLDRPTGLWVHNGCGRPSKAYVTDEGTYTLTPRVKTIPIPKKDLRYDEGWFTWT